jgi:transcriptional repressor NrdR
MRCPSCNEDDNHVIDSRLTEGGRAIRRRRLCQVCGRRFTTKERIEDELRLTVIKAGGDRVPYNRDKILAGVERACYKLPVTDEQLQQLVDGVEEELLKNHDRDVATECIGRYVAERLRRLHPVAYIRFMSVHRKFSSVEQFIEEITEVRTRAAQESPHQQPLFDV